MSFQEPAMTRQARLSLSSVSQLNDELRTVLQRASINMDKVRRLCEAGASVNLAVTKESKLLGWAIAHWLIMERPKDAWRVLSTLAEVSDIDLYCCTTIEGNLYNRVTTYICMYLAVLVF